MKLIKITLILCCSFLIESCKKQKVTFNLEQKIDVMFQEYIKENYINESVINLYERTQIICPNKNRILKTAFLDDQKVRKNDYSNMLVIDSINVVKVISLLEKCNLDGLSRNGHTAIFSVLQHSNDKDLMAFYYETIKNFTNNNNLDRAFFAMYIDRFLMLHDKKQIFGTQINNLGNLYKIENTKNINTRRKKMNLETIENYLNRQGLDYKEEIKSF